MHRHPWITGTFSNGGWLDHTLFGTVRVSGTETGEENFIGTETNAAFSGNVFESRPTGTGSAIWPEWKISKQSATPRNPT